MFSRVIRFRIVFLVIFVGACFIIFIPFKSSKDQKFHAFPEGFQDRRIQEKTTTPVYIVEEHHEVLTYWYNAANRGLLPTQNNTLFHIDGHKDGASPTNWQVIPFFRFPNSEEEIRLMMQNNDAFIFESVVTGFINRWIYVFSSWDPEQQLDDDYIKVTKYVGAYTLYSGNDTDIICKCEDEDGKRFCIREIGHRDDDLVVEISPDQCDIKRVVIREYMSERKAIELLNTKDWLLPSENLVLDIDEDFYGCEAACMPLYDVGISEHEIDDIKDLSSLVFCPENSLQERKMDQIFLKMTQRLSGWKPSSQNEAIKQKREFTEILLDELETVIDVNKIKRCRNNKQLFRSYLRQFVMKLANYNEEQLRALSEVGLCLRGTPKSADFDYREGARICDGYNRPKDSLVYFHTPTAQEIDERTIQLGEILHLIPEPDIVTVCRSMRDGYTPRKFFNKIEHDVLKVLVNNFDKVTNDSIHYDSDLLGGRYGWPDRHELK